MEIFMCAHEEGFWCGVASPDTSWQVWVLMSWGEFYIGNPFTWLRDLTTCIETVLLKGVFAGQADLSRQTLDPDLRSLCLYTLHGQAQFQR